MCPVPNQTATAPSADLLTPDHLTARQAEDGLYGPRGWSVTAGVWPILLKWPDQMRNLRYLLGQEEDPSDALDATGAPQEDYLPFIGLDETDAAALLKLLPEQALEDRQNLGPSLGVLLRACAEGKGRVRLSGYGIGPQRHDERVSVEAIWVSDPALAGFKVSPTHGPGCECRQLWERLSQRHSLDAEGMPDEILRMTPAWADDEEGWWFWWD